MKQHLYRAAVAMTAKCLTTAALMGTFCTAVYFSEKAQAQPGIATSKSKLATYEVEVVTLRDRGFEPSQIVRKPGMFHLVLNNFREGKLSEFEIVDDKGYKQKGLSLDSEKAKHWNDQLELAPGKYVLRLRNQPAVLMQITIDPNKR